MYEGANMTVRSLLPQVTPDSKVLASLELAVCDCVAQMPPDQIRDGVASIADLAELGRIVQRAYIGGAAGVSDSLAHELMETLEAVHRPRIVPEPSNVPDTDEQLLQQIDEEAHDVGA